MTLGFKSSHATREALDILIEGAAALAVELPADGAVKLIRLLDALDDWNQRMNLTAIKRREQQLTKHLLDSLSAQPFIKGERFADIGTGAGFPGLPLALVNPGKSFTLVDSTKKKLAFVQHAASVMGLTNVQTVHTRAEDYRPKERFDGVLSRAVGPIERFVESSGHLCAGGGRLLAMKGRFPAEELEHLPTGWKLAGAHRLTVPKLDEERHLVEICRSHDKVSPDYE
jgi:16S rRNA (guanine527-N7)-methyltransferase